MMISYRELSKNPRIFKGFAGVTVEEFDELESKAEPYWIEQEAKRLWRSNRQRAEGGGRQKTLAFRDQLLMTLIWLRLYLILEALGYLFGVDKSSASRYTNAILPALRQVGDKTLGWPEPPQRGQGKNLTRVWSENPELFAYVDTTEQRIRRSSNPEKQKKDYSGKKKTHTRKTQIIVNEKGLVRHVSESTQGSMHDRKHFSHSGAEEHIPKGIVVGGDSGYQGIQNNLPNHSVITPFKKSKLTPLTDEQKVLNQEFSRGRIIVENTLCQFKHFGALSQRFRHSVDLYDDVFRSVLAVVNPRIQKRLATVSCA